MSAKISLDQWQALIAVVDEGGYASAAEALDKSQSAISYAVQKIETELGVRAFALEGRRARLTETGQMLYRQAKVLVEEANRIESAAIQLSQGWEPLVRVAADALFPQHCMLSALDAFAQHSPLTRVEYTETVLSGSDEALLRKEADVVIGGRVSHPSTRIAAIRRGLGFAWVPEAEIGDGLETGALKVLPLKEGVERLVDLHLIYADGQYAGQAARYLGERIREAAAVPCPGVTVS